MNSNAGIFLDPILEQLKADSLATTRAVSPLGERTHSLLVRLLIWLKKSSNLVEAGFTTASYLLLLFLLLLCHQSPVMTKMEQQMLIDAAGNALAQNLPTDYCPRCWTLLGNLVIDGAIASASTMLGYIAHLSHQ